MTSIFLLFLFQTLFHFASFADWQLKKMCFLLKTNEPNYLDDAMLTVASLMLTPRCCNVNSSLPHKLYSQFSNTERQKDRKTERQKLDRQKYRKTKVRVGNTFDYGAGGPCFDSHSGWHFFGNSHLPSFWQWTAKLILIILIKFEIFVVCWVKEI